MKDRKRWHGDQSRAEKKGGENKMTKNLKKTSKLTILLSILIVSCVCFTSVTTVYAAEETLQEKSLTVVNDVMSVDLTKYTEFTKEHKEGLLSYLDVVPQKFVECEFTSSGSKLRMFFTFANEKLQMIQVVENVGTPSLTKATSTNTAVARSFLSNYRAYTSDSLYGELESTLDNVDASKNITKTSGNTVLEVSAIDGYTTFKWYYTSNGAIAPYSKFIVIGVKNGFLTAFVDNWQLYDVASTSVNLSEKEAIAIALEAAKEHSWSLKLDDDTLDVKNFNETNVRWTSLFFSGSLDADKTRNEDLLALYPVWRVGVALDKWYGYMYGIEVDVWADTKEVRRVHEAWSSMLPEEGNLTANLDQKPLVSGVTPNGVALIVFQTFAMFAFGTSVIWMFRKKKPQYYNTLKRKGHKLRGILLCIMLALPIFLGVISTVNATNPRGAVIWGSESTGAGPPDNNWRKSQNEIEKQRETASNLETYFIDAGYTGNDGINHQGIRDPGSDVSQILTYDLPTLTNNYDAVAVVDFNHGVTGQPPVGAPNEPHYMFEDNWGTVVGPEENPTTDFNHGVFDMYISPHTDDGNVIFAYISACLSADVDQLGQGILPPEFPPPPYERTIGMPFSWTHRLVVDKSATPGFTITEHISDDGYDDPDWGTQVYIGFPYGSASLEQPIPFDPPGNAYHYWVCSFLEHALTPGYSVNAALDAASWQLMNSSFADSPLRTGFTVYWSGFDPYDGNTLAVFGNGNINLRYYTPPADVASTPSVSGPAQGVVGISYEFSAFSTNPYGNNVQYRFDWDDGSPYTETGWYSDGTTAYASHSWSSGGTYNVKVQARCPSSEWSSWSNPETINIQQPQYRLTIQSSSGGYTDPPAGNYSYPYGSYVQVTAHVDDPEWWEWSHWIVDGQPSSDNPTITVPIDGDHTIKPVFIFNPPQYCLHIINWYGSYTVPSAGSYYYDAGTLAQVTAYVDDPEYWEWSHWELDGEYYSSNTHVTVVMHSDHTLRPICTYNPPPPPEYMLVIVYYGWVGAWVPLGGAWGYLPYGSYTFTAPSTFQGFNFMCWYYDGNYYYGQTITIFLDSDQYLYALYIP
jgi:hypothetical protein